MRLPIKGESATDRPVTVPHTVTATRPCASPKDLCERHGARTYQHCPADALRHPGADEHVGRGRQTSQQRGAGEDGQPGEEHRSTAGPPGYVARGKHTGGEGDDKTFNHPLELTERSVQAPLHCRQGYAYGHEVRQNDERGDANGYERAPLPDVP